MRVYHNVQWIAVSLCQVMYLMTGPSDDGRKDSTGSVITGKPSLDQARAVIAHEGGSLVVVTHDWSFLGWSTVTRNKTKVNISSEWLCYIYYITLVFFSLRVWYAIFDLVVHACASNEYITFAVMNVRWKRTSSLRSANGIPRHATSNISCADNWGTKPSPPKFKLLFWASALVIPTNSPPEPPICSYFTAEGVCPLTADCRACIQPQLPPRLGYAVYWTCAEIVL